MRAALLATIIVLTLGVLWLAGEEHYRGCVETAVAEHPPGLSLSTGEPGLTIGGQPEGPALRDAAGLSGPGLSTADRAVSGCSRWP